MSRAATVVFAWANGPDGGPGRVEVSARAAAALAVDTQVPQLVQESFASRLFAQDPTLWGGSAVSEASVRLAWVGLPASSRPLVEPVARLRAALAADGVDHVVLAGMGGSSLAPEVLCASAGRALTVLDSSDPDTVRDALADRLERTVVVVSSKSGSTVETDSQRRTYARAFQEAGLDPARRIVVVTDPGSALEVAARRDGQTVFLADPNVGGRYSALTAFGLVPAGLAGVDIAALLADAQSMVGALAQDVEGNPALVLGAAIAGAQPQSADRRDKLLLVPAGTDLVGFGDWAEQLIAESTGKDGTGLLPVVVDGPRAPELHRRSPDVLPVLMVASGGPGPGDLAEDDAAAPPEVIASEVHVGGTIGALMLLWEVATVVAGRLLAINPFDQPDVESAKRAARGLLQRADQPADPDLVVDGIEVRGSQRLLDGVHDLPAAVQALLDQLDPDRGYLAVMAYLDRHRQGDLAEVRDALARRTGRPTTYGWGPRFLHSTGQYHKGGPPTGVYLQITGAPQADLDVPGQPFTFGTLIAAQAAGDAAVLAEHGRPVLRLHLRDRATGVPALLAALR